VLFALAIVILALIADHSNQMPAPVALGAVATNTGLASTPAAPAQSSPLGAATPDSSASDLPELALADREAEHAVPATHPLVRQFGILLTTMQALCKENRPTVMRQIDSTFTAITSNVASADLLTETQGMVKAVQNGIAVDTCANLLQSYIASRTG
jgi:hypothetical protein